MANIDSPKGLRPLNAPNGNSPRVGEYVVPANAVVIYEGDIVARTETGVTVMSVLNSSVLVHSIRGVAAHHSPASTAKRNILVYDDPDQVFLIQNNSSTTNVLNTDAEVLAGIGQFASPTAYAAGDALGQSTLELDGGVGLLPKQALAEDGAVFQLLGVYPGATNVVTTSWTKFMVKFGKMTHIETTSGSLTV
jgi:hypothetical protein